MQTGMAGPTGGNNDVAFLKAERDVWLEAIQAGLKEKDRIYAKGAAEVMRFYLGQHSYLFEPKLNQQSLFLQVKTDPGNNQRQIRYPVFRLDDNVAAQYVQVYGPFLIHGEIVITATAEKPYMPPIMFYGVDMQPQSNDPQYMQQQMQLYQRYQMDQMQLVGQYQMKQAIAEMIERVLNYANRQLGSFAEREQAIYESLIVGGGPRLTEIVQMPGTGQKLISSNFVPMHDIVYDPDARRDKDCKWMAVQCRHPAWLVAKLYGIPEDDLRPNSASTVSERFHESLLTNAGSGRVKHTVIKDEVIYWKVWSRMGAGSRLATKDARSPYLELLDQALGDFVFMVVTECCDYPLNFGPNTLQQAAAMQQQQAMQGQMMQQPQDPLAGLKIATQWPIKFHYEVDDPWPITLYKYHHRNSSPYPVPPLEFCLSYIKFLVWIICFVADKCYRSNRDFWLLDETVAPQLREAIQNGEDEAVLNLKDLDEKTVANFVQMLEAPDIRKTIFDVYEFFNQKFQAQSGLTPLLQSQIEEQQAEPRSATQSQINSEASRLRPDDMSAKVKRTDTRIARKEAIASLTILTSQDVAGVLGIPGARAWDVVRQQIPIVQLMQETDFDIVSSEGRALDLQTRADQANQMVQFVLPLLIQVGQATGNFAQANALLADWAKSRQIDPDLVQIPPMAPPVQQQAQADMATQQHKHGTDVALAAHKAQLEKQKPQGASNGKKA